MNKLTRRILALLTSVVIVLNFVVFSAYASYSDVLEQNKVLDEDGNWVNHVSSGDFFDQRWSEYNCYAFAIRRAEIDGVYRDNAHATQYRPGDITFGIIPDGQAPNNLNKILENVESDLEILGCSNIQIYDSLPTSFSSLDELICVRMENADGGGYHFMRYDRVTDAWYHKPNNTAVLKFNGIPSEDVAWDGEYCLSDGVHKDGTTYSGYMKFITYREPLSISPQNTPINKTIRSGGDILCEVSISTAGRYNLSLSSNYALHYELYNESFNVVKYKGVDYATASINETTDSIPAGTYYLRVRTKDILNVDVNVVITIQQQQEEHQHSYPTRAIYYNSSLHKRVCSCGETEYENHYVRRADIVDGRYANCLGCLRRLDLTTGNVGIIMSNNIKITTNGSYLLPNGVVVLADCDIEAYLNGTLEFYIVGDSSEYN